MLTRALLTVHCSDMPLTSLCCRIGVKMKHIISTCFLKNAFYVPGTVLCNLLQSSHLILTLVL